MKKVIFKNPIFKEMVWGGNRLKKDIINQMEHGTVHAIKGGTVILTTK